MSKKTSGDGSPRRPEETVEILKTYPISVGILPPLDIEGEISLGFSGEYRVPAASIAERRIADT